MGLTWSDKKCKDDTMIVAKATITDEIKDDVWFLWNIAKKQPKLKDQLKTDGFNISKDQFDGGRWKIIWFYTVKEDSFDEVEVDDETLFKWQQELNDLTSKWIVKLAAIKDAIAGSDSDREPSVEDPYDNPDDETKVVTKKAHRKEVKKEVKKTLQKAEPKKEVKKQPILTEDEEIAISASIGAEKKTKLKAYDVTNVSIGAPKKPVKKAESASKKQVSKKVISDDEDY